VPKKATNKIEGIKDDPILGSTGTLRVSVGRLRVSTEKEFTPNRVNSKIHKWWDFTDLTYTKCKLKN
jgi:hypothetical protein